MRALLWVGLVCVSAGCVSTFNDAVTLSSGERLVVGFQNGFFSSSAAVWALENGELVEVEIVEVD
ncbi:MAG: hypothetical protein RL885_10610 [Planctomycetota bacterium]